MNIDWKPISTAPKAEFMAEDWYRRGYRLLLSDGEGYRPYFGSWQYTSTGKGRWKSDLGYVCSPRFWEEEPPRPAGR